MLLGYKLNTLMSIALRFLRNERNHFQKAGDASAIHLILQVIFVGGGDYLTFVTRLPVCRI